MVCIMFFHNQLVYAQPSFSNKTKLFKKQLPTRSVIPGGIADIDGDLIDDLLIVDKGTRLKAIKSTGQHFGLQLLDSINVSQSTKWSLTAGDLNNDGQLEILTSGEYNDVHINTLIDGKFTERTLVGNYFAQASNTVDINNDGWLDYFVCDDDAPNKVYINDTFGNLLLRNVIDFTLNDNTDGSGNYGSEWVDVNGDLLPDLCIAKCRAGVDSPSDKRRINRLYINQGDGSFVEKGAEYNINDGSQTWVITFGDLDNDGDQDAYVANHYAPHVILENVDGQYFRMLPQSFEIEAFSFQAVMRDLDNDGFLDIILAGVEGTKLLSNNGDKTFTIIDNIVGGKGINSMTLGDLNDDGFIDIYGHLTSLLNMVGYKDDELWLNDGNNNHYIKINLEGKNSNRSGIGAQLEIYGPWGKQVRYVKGGESYGIFNSLQQHFGIGNATSVDSLVIHWPAGTKDTYVNLQANKTYFAQEATCSTVQLSLYDQIVYITDQDIPLEASSNMAEYLWNTGATTQNINVTEPGVFHVRMTDENGCATISKPMVVRSGCFQQNTKLINEEPNITLCSGTIANITAVDAKSYIWSNGNTTSSIDISESQTLTLSATDFCGQTLEDQITIQFDEVILSLQPDTVLKNETATLISSNVLTRWYQGINDNIPIFVGDTLITSPLSNSTTYYAQATDIINNQTTKVGEINFPLDNLYGSNNTVGGLFFSVDQPCTLVSVMVNTDTEGSRKIIITDIFESILFSKDVYLTNGIQKIILQAPLEPGQTYKILTDTDTNIANFGHKSPRLTRTFNSTKYPYESEPVTIFSSILGAIYYYYFYDWEVSYDEVYCDSERKEVTAYVDIDSGISTPKVDDNITVLPNPSFGTLNIAVASGITVESVHVYDLQSRQVLRAQRSEQSTIDISSLPSGLYVIHVATNIGNKYFKIVKH